MKKILALFAVFLAVSGVAIAMNNVTVTANDQTRWAAPAVTNTDITEGGNITQVDLGENRLTDRWAGYYGNITSTVILRDNTSANWLYRWTTDSSNVTNGEVCASVNQTFDFASAGVTTAAEIDTAWGFISGLDLATNTFNDGTCNLTFTQDSWSVNDTVKADGDSGASSFSTCAIEQTATPGKYDIAFCTDRIRSTASATNFKGEAVNFEFIVAANASSGGTETYYFFMEIDG